MLGKIFDIYLPQIIEYDVVDYTILKVKYIRVYIRVNINERDCYIMLTNVHIILKIVY